MAISRFRKTFAKLDPTLYVPEKRNLVPDITPLTNIATGMQSLFDDVSIIQPPAHLTNDAQDVQSRYINPIKEAKDKAVETFRTNNSLEGVKALRDIKAFMIESNQPGGVAYNFKANAEASSKWNEDLKSRLAKGDITQDIYNHYVSNASKFKSYNDDGEYNSFQGGQPASYVDLKKMFDDIAGKYKADKNYTFQSNGIYTHKITNEIVDLKTVYAGLMQSVMADGKAFSYIQDLQRVYGTEKAMKMVNDMAYSSADAAAYVDRDISMFSTDQLALHMAKKSIDKELEKQDALDRGILSDITLKNETSNPLKLKTGVTVNDEMKVDMYGKVLNGFYRDDEGNIYQREINGKYKSLTGEYHKKTKKGKSVKVETESGKTMEIEPESIEGEGLGLKAVNLATLDNVKDKKIIDFLDKEMTGLRETAIQLQKEKGKDISVGELNATTLKRYKDSQSKQISMFQKMIVPDKDNKIDGVKLTDLASQLSGRVDESNVYMFNEKGTKSIPNDDVIKDIAKGLEDYYWKKDNKPTSGGWFSGKKVDYKIVGKFGEDVLANPNSYVIKDSNGNKYLIDTGTPEQKNKSFRFQPMVNAINTPGRSFQFNTIPPLGNVLIQNINSGEKTTGMTIIPTNSYRGGNIDDNTKVGDVSIISQPKFDANNNMLNYGEGSDLVIKFTEQIFNPQTEKFTKGEDYIINVSNNNFTGLSEILRNQ
jgi:hypothetical protein